MRDGRQWGAAAASGRALHVIRLGHRRVLALADHLAERRPGRSGRRLLTAWRRLDAVPNGDAARIWLYATARRVIANQRRSSRRRAALQERLALEVPSDTEKPEGEHVLVHEALTRLRPTDREVLLLAEWEGLSPAQIAGVVGCLTVTARGRLHRARRRFRAAYEELLGRRLHPTATTRSRTTALAAFAKEDHEHA